MSKQNVSMNISEKRNEMFVSHMDMDKRL